MTKHILLVCALVSAVAIPVCGSALAQKFQPNTQIKGSQVNQQSVNPANIRSKPFVPTPNVQIKGSQVNQQSVNPANIRSKPFVPTPNVQIK